MVKRLAEEFSTARADLEKQWDTGSDVSDRGTTAGPKALSVVLQSSPSNLTPNCWGRVEEGFPPLPLASLIPAPRTAPSIPQKMTLKAL